MNILLIWLVQKAYAGFPTLGVPTTALPTATAPPNSLNLPDLSNLANYILDFLTKLAYPLAFIAIIYTAYILINSASNPDVYTKAKKNIIYLILGIFFVIFAVTLLNLAQSLFSYGLTS